MFYEIEFRVTCGDGEKNALNWDILPRDTDSLNFASLISTKDNVFTVVGSVHYHVNSVKDK